MTRVLHLDRTRCDGRGLCVELLAARLQRDEWGYPVLHHGELPLRPTDEAAAADAVALCPVLALTVVDR
jgi:ferredoxin